MFTWYYPELNEGKYWDDWSGVGFYKIKGEDYIETWQLLYLSKSFFMLLKILTIDNN